MLLVHIFFPNCGVYATSVVSENHGKATNTFTCVITGDKGKIVFESSPWMPVVKYVGVNAFRWMPKR